MYPLRLSAEIGQACKTDSAQEDGKNDSDYRFLERSLFPVKINQIRPGRQTPGFLVDTFTFSPSLMKGEPGSPGQFPAWLA